MSSPAPTTEISTTALVLIPAVAALAGAFIGSAASLIATFIHERNEHRRTNLRLAVDAAIHEHALALEAAKLRPGKTYLFPLSDFIHFHITLLKLIETGRLNPETLAELDRHLAALHPEHPRTKPT